MDGTDPRWETLVDRLVADRERRDVPLSGRATGPPRPDPPSERPARDGSHVYAGIVVGLVCGTAALALYDLYLILTVLAR